MKSYLKAIFNFHWFSKWWWDYLLESDHKSDKYLYDRWRTVSMWRKFWCRARGHPDGVWWFSNNEPDMHCKNCGDDLG